MDSDFRESLVDPTFLLFAFSGVGRPDTDAVSLRVTLNSVAKYHIRLFLVQNRRKKL